MSDFTPDIQEIDNLNKKTTSTTEQKPLIDYTKLIISLAISALILGSMVAISEATEALIVSKTQSKHFSPLKTKTVKAIIIIFITIFAIIIFVRFVK